MKFVAIEKSIPLKIRQHSLVFESISEKSKLNFSFLSLIVEAYRKETFSGFLCAR
jgi:hypothetical protein